VDADGFEMKTFGHDGWSVRICLAGPREMVWSLDMQTSTWTRPIRVASPWPAGTAIGQQRPVCSRKKPRCSSQAGRRIGAV